MTCCHRIHACRLALAASIAVGGVWGPRAASHAFAQTGGASNSVPAKRTPQQIIAENDQAAIEFAKALGSADNLFDPKKHPEIAPKALPAMRRMVACMDEFAAAVPEAATQVMFFNMETTRNMALLGDAAALETLKKQAISTRRDEAAAAKAHLLVVEWVRNRPDPAAQRKTLDAFRKLVDINTEHETMVLAAMTMSESAATPAIAAEVEDIVLKTLTSPEARRAARMIGNRRTRQGLVGAPLVIEGVTVEGKPFSTAAWKGNVVVVDFWATTEPACITRLPLLKRLYAKEHPNGLEIVGIANDADAENFRAFLKDNKEMPWPQLFDPLARNGIHPLVTRFGVEQLGTMFVIDRKGVCRSVTADENLPEVVEKLMAEK